MEKFINEWRKTFLLPCQISVHSDEIEVENNSNNGYGRDKSPNYYVREGGRLVMLNGNCNGLFVHCL